MGGTTFRNEVSPDAGQDERNTHTIVEKHRNQTDEQVNNLLHKEGPIGLGYNGNPANASTTWDPGIAKMWSGGQGGTGVLMVIDGKTQIGVESVSTYPMQREMITSSKATYNIDWAAKSNGSDKQPIVVDPWRNRTSWISPCANRCSINRRWNRPNQGSANAPGSPRARQLAPCSSTSSW